MSFQRVSLPLCYIKMRQQGFIAKAEIQFRSSGSGNFTVTQVTNYGCVKQDGGSGGSRK